MTPQEMVAQAKSQVPVISCADYLKMKEDGTDHVLLDVREKDEFDAGHIDGAVNLPRGLVEFKVVDVVPDKRTLVVVQCASGGRAALCGVALGKMGYENVRNLEGGYVQYCKEAA
jgi:sulfur dioxygenase